MAAVIFDLLKIVPDGCVIDFYDEKEFKKNLSGDTAGFYTKTKNEDGKEKEIILVNSKYKGDPLAVGAILAHEMMHLYLFRLNLKLDDTQENELLTDLVTINTGFSVLILNGMSYSSQWWLTIIMLALGRIYWRSEQLAFGYFKPKEYGCHAMSYFKEKNLSIEDIIGYLNPTSRHFVTRRPFLKGKQSTEFIKLLEKRHRKSNTIKGAVAAVIVVPLVIWGWSSDDKKQDLRSQIQSCGAELSVLENKIDADGANLENMKLELAQYENDQDVERYNDLVDPYNTLLAQVKEESLNYKNKLANCNVKIDQYNKR